MNTHNDASDKNAFKRLPEELRLIKGIPPTGDIKITVHFYRGKPIRFLVDMDADQ